LRRPAYGATTAPGDKFCGVGALDRARTIVEQLGGALSGPSGSVAIGGSGMTDPATVACHACGQETPSGKKFCIHCGTPVRAPCPACGEPLMPGARFCAECGTPLGASAGPSGSALHSERRLVSVLFADLVGFTTLSEHRDPEEVRELLSRFERCRAVIKRYGGTVEKFIRDAVMAVWGTPVAREDDAERAVRAGLALTQVVSDLGPELKARVGVLTGSAAVDLAAEGEGMVLGGHGQHGVSIAVDRGAGHGAGRRRHAAGLRGCDRLRRRRHPRGQRP
jgi:Adenylate and Guanylate cyclase catalytic domain/Double zinc ribbon